MKNGLKWIENVNIFYLESEGFLEFYGAMGLIIRRVWAKFPIPLILGLRLGENQTSEQPSPSKIAIGLST